MADKHDKDDDKKKDAPKSEEPKRYKPHGLTWWQDLIWDLVAIHGAPFVWRLFQRIVLHRTANEGSKPKHLVSFAEAMTKLKQVDENAFDKINDFMTVRLISTTDREDFQVRSARMGGTDDIDTTVAFLRIVAALPDHDARYAFLEMYGYIGERAVDMSERVLGWAGQAVNYLTSIKANPEFLSMIDEDTQRQRTILAQLEARLGGNTGSADTSVLNDFVTWYRAHRQRRREVWRQRWERFRAWRLERRKYVLLNRQIYLNAHVAQVREFEETRRVKAQQPKRRRFFTFFHYRSR